MVSNRRRNVTWPILVAGLAAPFLLDCGKMPGMDSLNKLKDAAADCPDIASVEAIASADFSKLGLDVEGAVKMKGALTASLALTDLAASIEADLKGACTKIATDLDQKVPEDAKAEAACKIAAKAIGDIKAKAGGSFSLSIKPPVCSASMSAMAECAGSCDASVSGGKAEVKCEGGELSGECGAKCEGKCSMEAGAACSGECGGSCEGEISGKCNGKCDGKCDGKATAKGGAECAGKCDGKCDGKAEATCKGTCKGDCKLTAGGECKGTCSGKCSVDFKAPKCSGKIEPPKVSADCKAKCDAQVNAKLECTPASVAIKANGTADVKSAEKLVAVLQADLPLVLKVALGMKDKAVGAAGNVKAVVEGVQGSMKTMVKGGPTAAGKLAMCVGGKFTGAFDAAASINVNVNVSVNVQASASGSASGGTK